MSQPIAQKPIEVVDASPENPALLVVQNLGAADTPTLYLGADRTSLYTHGLQIGPGGSSPQITVTSPYYVIADGMAVQNAVINVNRLK